MDHSEESEYSDSERGDIEAVDISLLENECEIENNLLEVEEQTIEKKLSEESMKQGKMLESLNFINNLITNKNILQPIYQDISPSFADEVPFLVDGDSLLVTVMLDANWTEQLGGSTLHMIYLFERYLDVFVQRGGNFHLVFFECWRNVWNENWMLLLNRQILIHHFSKNMEQYPVHLVNHCMDKRFFKLLSTIRPGFILTNLDMIKNCSNLPNIDTKYVTHMSNIFVLSCLRMDLPCVDTNFIQVDISVVNAFYLDTNHIAKKCSNLYEALFKEYLGNVPKLKEIVQLVEIQNERNYNIRTRITLLAASMFYENTKNEEMLKRIFLTITCMESLELKNRCCPKLTECLNEYDAVVSEWQKSMFLVLSKLINEESDWSNIADLWQGILFGHVCRFTSNGIRKAEELGTNIASLYEKFVEEFNNIGYAINPYPIKESEVNIEWNTYEVSTINTDFSSLLQINNPLVDQFCSSVLHDIRWCTPPDSLFKPKEYSEEHHYHSMGVIYDEHDHVPSTFPKIQSDDPRAIRRYQQQISRFARYMTLYGSSIEGRQLETRAIIRDTNIVPTKKQKVSKKAQAIIDKNMEKKNIETLKREKESLDRLEDLWNRSDTKCETMLHAIKLELNKIRPDSPLQLDIITLKLKILLKAFKNKREGQSNSENDMKKEIFLTVRTAISLCDVKKVTNKQQELMSKCLDIIGCQEIAKRNGLPIAAKNKCVSDDSWIRYQLVEIGSELIRETSGVPDRRADGFIPDPWQSHLFDIIDKKQSALIVAPTSSGKTYASYYCMERVIRESTDGVVVYVSPTKALVNQVAATVYARFKDTNMPDGMSVYGVFTRDYRTHSLTSQVLITVPQCLEILLLSARCHNWVHRLRYVIFDEVHCIASNLGGLTWERCLLLIPCPFLALSATIRNPKQLHAWLQRAEDFKLTQNVNEQIARKPDSYKVNLIIHSERHSDLTKYMYGDGELHHLHPFMHLEPAVINNHGGIPGHILLSPAETLQLYEAMIYANSGSEQLKELAPEKYFSEHPKNGFITRNLVRKYEQELSSLLMAWFNNNLNDFKTTIKYLKPVTDIDKIGGTDAEYIIRNIKKFVLHLRNQNMLPAIVFCYSRNLISMLTLQITNYFLQTKPVINRREERKHDKQEKKEKKITQKSAAKEGIETRTRRPRTSLNLLSGGSGNSLQGVGMVDSKDVELIEHRLSFSGSPNLRLIIQAIQNGICMHHAGLNNKIRSAVEMLFRKRVLNVVFATGTLALGIHMPCKTTVIAGNSPYLNSLEYHQMSGRAGRRGYDTAGNVIFLGLNPRKQHTLLTAQLPDITGNFPMSVTFALRLLLLVSDVTDRGRQTKRATNITVSRVMALLENSLVFMQKPQLKIHIKHFFSFSLQLLKMQEFINDLGDPLRWCGMATHLHYHEPGNLAFVYLLRNGIIRKLCTEMDNETDIMFNLVIILSHLFTKYPYKPSTEKFANSRVILDPLPDFVHEALVAYNEQVNFVFNQYFINVAMQSTDTDNILPLSSIRIVPENAIGHGASGNELYNKFLELCPPKLACSSFATLSGNNDDNLHSTANLVNNIKQTLCTDVQSVPVIDLERNLNGYALDFYRHGIVSAIRNDNGLKQGAEFDLLNDFMLVIKTIVVSLEEMQVLDENDLVFRHFNNLSAKYTELYSNGFGKDNSSA